MPHDPVLVAETKDWFAKAANDLRAAEHEFTAVPPLLSDIVFHCQQAAEKAMKGFLTWHNTPFPRPTALRKSVSNVSGLTLHSSPSSIAPCRSPITLGGFATRPRPRSHPYPKPTRRWGLAREVYETILSRLPGEVRP
jgi:hypothetical protein